MNRSDGGEIKTSGDRFPPHTDTEASLCESSPSLWVDTVPVFDNLDRDRLDSADALETARSKRDLTYQPNGETKGCPDRGARGR